MTALTRSEGRMPSLFDTAFSRDPFALARQLLSWEPGVDDEERAFIPRFNVVEKEDSYRLTADLPGVSENDVEVTMHDGRLTIAGKRDAEERSEGDSYYLLERRHGSFSRTFALPENADAESVEAELKNGVLQLRIAKKEAARPRRIALKK